MHDSERLPGHPLHAVPESGIEEMWNELPAPILNHLGAMLGSHETYEFQSLATSWVGLHDMNHSVAKCVVNVVDVLQMMRVTRAHMISSPLFGSSSLLVHLGDAF